MNAPDIALTSEELTTLEHEVENLIGFVNESMSNRSDISELIGMSSTEMMQDNHRNSARFILTSVSIGDFRKLKDTMPWVYATYHNHGFSYQYFAIVFETWIQAVHKFIDPPLSEKYASIYEWLSEHHKDWIELSQHYTSENIQPPKEWSRIQDQFLNALLAADTSTCLELANTHIQTHTDVQHFYLDVIQPSLYEIGILWHNNEISVSQEHLASSIVTRVMSMIYINNFTSKGDKGKVVITAGANEFHEIGAWMISDLLEMNGWDVYYLGSNTPESDLYQMLLAVQPHILVISVTMFFNLSSAAFVIRAIKQNPDIQNIKILLGGAAVKADPDLTKKLGADATADHAVEALKLVNDLAPQTGA